MISVVSSEEHGENEIICMPVPRNGQYEAIQFLKEKDYENCGLVIQL